MRDFSFLLIIQIFTYCVLKQEPLSSELKDPRYSLPPCPITTPSGGATNLLQYQFIQIFADLSVVMFAAVCCYHGNVPQTQPLV